MNLLLNLSLIVLFANLSYNHCAEINDSKSQSSWSSLIGPVFGFAAALQLMACVTLHCVNRNNSIKINNKKKFYNNLRLYKTPFMGKFEENSTPIEILDQYKLNEAKKSAWKEEKEEKEEKETSTEKKIRMKIAIKNNMSALLQQENREYSNGEEPFYGPYFDDYFKRHYKNDNEHELLTDHDRQIDHLAEQASQNVNTAETLEKDFRIYKKRSIMRLQISEATQKEYLEKTYDKAFFLHLSSLLTAGIGWALYSLLQ